MTNKITFSIIVPTYNRSAIIGRAINSVINQSFTDWELIIVDDGSTDNTKDSVLLIKDKRIKYIYQQNSERSAARNNGIQNASGQFICFLDSDDEFMEDHLSILNDFICKRSFKECVLRSFAIEREIQKDINQPLVSLITHPVNYLFKSTIYPTSLCIHSNILKKYKFNTDLFLAEDTDLLVRIFSEYPLCVIEKYSVIIHKGAENTQSQLNGDKHVIYFKNLNKTFSDPSISPFIDKKLKNDLLSRRLSWAIFAYSDQKEKRKGRSQFFSNFWLLLNNLGFIKTLKLFYYVV